MDDRGRGRKVRHAGDRRVNGWAWVGISWVGTSLICAVALWASARDKTRPEVDPPAPPVSLDQRTLPPGDGCSISDYYFEHALD